MKEVILWRIRHQHKLESMKAQKKQAVELLEGLGLNLSDAVNMFLRQVILRNGIPFEVKYPEFKPEVIEAMEEAKRISRDPNTKRYNSFSEALEDMDL